MTEVREADGCVVDAVDRDQDVDEFLGTAERVGA